MQRHFSWIFQAVLAADRDIDLLVLRNEHGLLAALHQGGSLNDHPMLSAMEMLLQTQLAARLDRDPLDLKSVAAVDRLERPPRAIRCRMLNRLEAILVAQGKGGSKERSGT